MRRTRFVMAALSLLASACVHAPPEARGHDNSLITEDEIVASRAETAYDAVKLLRGNFLSYRGRTTLQRDSSSSSLPTIFLDDQEYGPLLTLRSIPAGNVVQIRLYRSWEASTKYGAKNMGGVIEVVTRH